MEIIQAYSLQEKYAEKNTLACFCFLKQIRKKYWRTCQDTDVPTKILEENADLFADLHLSFNASKHNSSF